LGGELGQTKKSGGIATHTKDLFWKKYFEEKTFEIARFKL
jgi:hypothetical protein